MRHPSSFSFPPHPLSFHPPAPRRAAMMSPSRALVALVALVALAALLPCGCVAALPLAGPDLLTTDAQTPNAAAFGCPFEAGRLELRWAFSQALTVRRLAAAAGQGAGARHRQGQRQERRKDPPSAAPLALLPCLQWARG